ncbi:uncharacterized protein C8Q71DRAFT_591279 [Rhodofomes roseus]|uniref:Uncharacterized protein n=1 Tax=Rhodofomes roseus TaxID=34475 RepID=A0ABQ8KHD7_9APHY|nr:uncharacterized protein C8Q71DRAFT_591279 [Rhodofomes roseus]KAH9837217.1 hypothetical protein C8Q71DRAFT_591279 [Rhodofomes roseus]
MSTPRSPSQPLNYFQQSPVRGQLENPDGQYARSGWRYLQCTDTPNELRVLLPPRTALIYSHLLRAELIELRKDRDAAWDRILQIRHLKDRMIRKCQRLAKESAPTGKPAPRTMFFTVHAPPDYRLKEMERWFREQGAHFGSDVAQGHSRTPYCCNKCMPPAHTNHQGTLSRKPSAQAYRHGPPPDRVPARRGDSTTHTTTTLLNSSPPPGQHPRRQPPPGYKTSGRVPAVVRDPDHASPHRKTTERRRSAGSDVSTGTRSARLNAKSPDPLPIPFRMHDPNEEPPFVDSPDDSLEDELPSTSPEPEAPHEAAPLPALNGQLPTIHEASEGQASVAGEDAQRPIPRRRSSLKRAGSISRLSIASQTKSVAWAMDRDWIEQMSQYMKTANEAEVLVHELEELRSDYHKEVDAMKRMCRGVSEASERLRLEMEKLHRDEEAVRKQEDRLLHTIEQLERKETQFRDKVVSVLEETKRVVHLCDKKRDIHEL